MFQLTDLSEKLEVFFFSRNQAFDKLLALLLRIFLSLLFVEGKVLHRNIVVYLSPQKIYFSPLKSANKSIR